MLSRQRTTKALIRLRGCAGWSAPLLFAYDINRFSQEVAQMHLYQGTCKWITTYIRHRQRCRGRPHLLIPIGRDPILHRIFVRTKLGLSPFLSGPKAGLTHVVGTIIRCDTLRELPGFQDDVIYFTAGRDRTRDFLGFGGRMELFWNLFFSYSILSFYSVFIYMYIAYYKNK